MACNNYMDHLAPGDRGATDLKGADQRGQQARNRLNEQDGMDRNQPLMPIYDEAFFEQRRQDRIAIQRIQKRGLRGGDTFLPEDAF